jgi:hypothetical protein
MSSIAHPPSSTLTDPPPRYVARPTGDQTAASYSATSEHPEADARPASETGSVLNVYKNYLRDGIDLAANREFLRGELGDLLWYTAAVATSCGLDLEDVAQANLARANRLVRLNRHLMAT